MPSAMVPIQSITLTAVTNTITFSNIPQNYKDLVLIVNYKILTAGNPRFYFNADSGSLYNLVYMDGYGASKGSGIDNAQTSNSLTYTPANTTQVGSVVLNCLDYSSVDKHKTSLIKSGSGLGIASSYVTRYASTNAITRLDVFNHDYQIGSSFALYGVLA